MKLKGKSTVSFVLTLAMVLLACSISAYAINDGASLTYEISAAQVFSFSKTDTLTALENLGGRNNVYVVFTELPKEGKLYYNWGTPVQETVKVGTAYYISYTDDTKQLSNVTFVPSYSADKAHTKTVSISVRTHDAIGWRTSGKINIAVNYAAASARFSDVGDPVYAESVDFLFNEGITSGTNVANSIFSPYNTVSRAEFVTFLWRATGSPDVADTDNTFTDVKNSGAYQFAYEAILWAVENDIINGRTSTRFDPGGKITNQELLTFLYRYEVVYLDHFSGGSYIIDTDDYPQVAEWAELAVKWATYKGILTAENIQFTANCTRANLALWLHRMLTL